jgi:hypothetical protein
MDCVECLRGIFSTCAKNHASSAGMILDESCHVEHSAVDNDPATRGSGMVGHFISFQQLQIHGQYRAIKGSTIDNICTRCPQWDTSQSDQRYSCSRLDRWYPHVFPDRALGPCTASIFRCPTPALPIDHPAPWLLREAVSQILRYYQLRQSSWTGIVRSSFTI